MQKKTEIQDFKVLEIELRDQAFLKGGGRSTETILNTSDPNSPTGFSDDCRTRDDGHFTAYAPLTNPRRPNQN